jgi:hypothetical protein
MDRGFLANLSRRAALLAGIVATIPGVAATAKGANPDVTAAASPSDGPPPLAEARRKTRPYVWRARFDSARIEPHPNGQPGEYLAHLTGGPGDGRCRHRSSVRRIGHDRLARCIDRDERDLSDGHVGAWLRGKPWRVLDQSWDGASEELQLHLRAQRTPKGAEAAGALANEAGLVFDADDGMTAILCFCEGVAFPCFVMDTATCDKYGYDTYSGEP